MRRPSRRPSRRQRDHPSLANPCGLPHQGLSRGRRSSVANRVASSDSRLRTDLRPPTCHRASRRQRLLLPLGGADAARFQSPSRRVTNSQGHQVAGAMNGHRRCVRHWPHAVLVASLGQGLAAENRREIKLSKGGLRRNI